MMKAEIVPQIMFGTVTTIVAISGICIAYTNRKREWSILAQPSIN